MKKLLLIVAIAMFSLTTYSQTNKGTLLIDGQSKFNLSFLNSKTEYGSLNSETKTTSFSLQPSLGYFLVDNFALGLFIDLNLSKISKSNYDYSSSTILIGPFARYYFGSSNVRPFLNAEIGIASSKEEEGSQTSKFSGFGYGVGAGIAFVLTENVALNAGVSYSGTSLKNSDDSDLKNNTGSVNLGLGFSIHL